ncbi:MAG: MBL fold metallo-hydrolase [Firmicutes bacterium]|nr:MBL fold metallo-hydrolase [Bacillota bacterium]
MLKLHFINVADGDSILVEALEGPRIFRALVDAGPRRVCPSAGSLRNTAPEYLHQLGIRRLDMLVITHLHMDHFGGLRPLLEGIRVDHVYAGYFPAHPGGQIFCSEKAEKTVRGLTECLNEWSRDTAALLAAGSRLHPLTESIPLALTDRLHAELIVPNRRLQKAQQRCWDRLAQGETVSADALYWTSKSRNPGSLRVRLQYGVRRIELTGDCYGAVWDQETLLPCDILKVPHHGDGKAMTEVLAQKLRPVHGVISCAAEYDARKNRPSLGTMEILSAQGTHIWFTDGYSTQPYTRQRWPAAVFTILEDGTVRTPEGKDGR